MRRCSIAQYGCIQCQGVVRQDSAQCSPVHHVVLWEGAQGVDVRQCVALPSMGYNRVLSSSAHYVHGTFTIVQQCAGAVMLGQRMGCVVQTNWCADMWIWVAQNGASSSSDAYQAHRASML